MIQNSLLAYVRTQEDAADRAGVRFLTATGQSAKGMYETFKRLADQILYSARYIDPYMQSHPLPAERVRALEGLAKASPHWDKKDSPALQARHDLDARQALRLHRSAATASARRYPISDNSLPARYARAIAAYRFGDLPRRARADRRADPGAAAEPLFPRAQGPGAAGRRPGRRGDRAAAARGAARAQPGADPDHARRRRCSPPTTRRMPRRRSRCWRPRSRREPESPEAYTQLAMAYGRKGDLARADLASAQAAFMRGDLQDRARSSRPAPRPASRSARPAGSRPTTSPATSRRPAATLN